MDPSEEMVLRAHCSHNSSNVGPPCSGTVRWEMTLLSVASAEAVQKDAERRQRLSGVIDGGNTLTATRDMLPQTTGYVTYEIKASGQSAHIFVIVHCFNTNTKLTIDLALH